MKRFRIISKNTQNHWLELEGWDEGCGVIEKNGSITPIYNVHVVCKWDGCVDYRSYSNGYGWDHKCDEDCESGRGCCQDYIHICDLSDFIEELKEVRRQAKDFFKNKTGEEYWKD